VWLDIRETYGLGCCWIVVSDDGTETYAGCIKLWGPYVAHVSEAPKGLDTWEGGRWPLDPNSPSGPSRSDYVARAYGVKR
jgi:hypothetical protein